MAGNNQFIKSDMGGLRLRGKVFPLKRFILHRELFQIPKIISFTQKY